MRCHFGGATLIVPQGLAAAKDDSVTVAQLDALHFPHWCTVKHGADAGLVSIRQLRLLWKGKATLT